MTPSRREVLAAAGAGFVLLPFAKAADAAVHVDEAAISAETVAKLVRTSELANAALMRGDIDQYRVYIQTTGDFTLMAPFGGKPTRGYELTDERWEAVGRFFKNGDFEQEVVETYASSDLVVLVLIERSNVEVGGLSAQDWSLRVTLVYRRDGSQWLLAHRHADPLVKGVSLEQAAALTRGEMR